jgi:hypothetical protein
LSFECWGHFVRNNPTIRLFYQYRFNTLREMEKNKDGRCQAAPEKLTT